MGKYVLLIGCLLWGRMGFAQQPDASEARYQEIIDKYNGVLNRLENPTRIQKDSVMALRADEFEQLYENYPATETGQKAIEQAFVAWLNVDELERMQSVIQNISINDDLWIRLSKWIRLAYSNQSMTEEYSLYLLELYETEFITNTMSKSYIASRLGRYYFKKNEFDRATKFYREVIVLAVDSIQVAQAQRELYDMNSLSIGNSAPDFTAESLEGETITLSELKGKYVLLEFWAIWCGPCLPEIPYLKKVFETYEKSDEFKMIGVSLDKDSDLLKKFVLDNDIHWTIIKDQQLTEEKWNGAIAYLYAASNGIPKSFLIDKEGIIVELDLRKDDLLPVLAKYLAID